MTKQLLNSIYKNELTCAFCKTPIMPLEETVIDEYAEYEVILHKKCWKKIGMFQINKGGKNAL